MKLNDEDREIVREALERLLAGTSRNNEQRKYGRVIDLIDRVRRDA